MIDVNEKCSTSKSVFIQIETTSTNQHGHCYFEFCENRFATTKTTTIKAEIFVVMFHVNTFAIQPQVMNIVWQTVRHSIYIIKFRLDGSELCVYHNRKMNNEKWACNGNKTETATESLFSIKQYRGNQVIFLAQIELELIPIKM